HVHLQNVGPAVVVEIGDINAHTRKTRVLEPRAGPIGKRSIAVVDVEDVIGCDVVRDVEVGPPVPVQVGHRHAESIPELPQYPRFLRYIGECPVAVVAIELVVAGRAVTAYAPVAHRSVLMPADSVMSSNRMLPLFRYRRLETMLPAKKMSGRPSLSMSPTATPPPL